jgi:hypothetical protein
MDSELITQAIKRLGFTPKEIETYMLMHDFRKNASSGEMTISFHNYDFDKVTNIIFEGKQTGQVGTATVDFASKLWEVLERLQSTNGAI